MTNEDLNRIKLRRIRVWSYWVLGVFVAVTISVLIADVRTTYTQRDGCERRQDIFHEVTASLDIAASNADSPSDAADYRGQAKRIRANIVSDCNAAYPHIIPFVR